MPAFNHKNAYQTPSRPPDTQNAAPMHPLASFGLGLETLVFLVVLQAFVEKHGALRLFDGLTFSQEGQCVKTTGLYCHFELFGILARSSRSTGMHRKWRHQLLRRPPFHARRGVRMTVVTQTPANKTFFDMFEGILKTFHAIKCASPSPCTGAGQDSLFP